MALLYRFAAPLETPPERTYLEEAFKSWWREAYGDSWDLKSRDEDDFWCISGLAGNPQRSRVTLGLGNKDDKWWLWFESDLPDHVVVQSADLKPTPTLVSELIHGCHWEEDWVNSGPLKVTSEEELVAMVEAAPTTEPALFLFCGVAESGEFTRSQKILDAHLLGVGKIAVIPEGLLDPLSQICLTRELNPGAVLFRSGGVQKLVPSSAIQRNPEAGGRLLQAYGLMYGKYGLPLEIQQRRRRAEFLSAQDTGDQKALLDLLGDYEQQLQNQEERNVQLEASVESVRFELELRDEDIRDSDRRLRTLQWEIDNPGKHIEDDDDDHLEEMLMESCAEVLEFARELLPNIDIQANPRPVEELDSHELAREWAVSAWRMLVAVNDYVDSKKDRKFEGNLYAYATSPPLRAKRIMSKRVAMQESESTATDRETVRERTFSVPKSIDQSGKIFMPAHLKVSNGGYYPRVHFYDDSRGSTGKVIIGYFGKHLGTGS